MTEVLTILAMTTHSASTQIVTTEFTALAMDLPNAIILDENIQCRHYIPIVQSIQFLKESQRVKCALDLS